ncbi:MAG: hypothetical protein R2911_27690 [Caldilineaceae bacterium]
MSMINPADLQPADHPSADVPPVTGNPYVGPQTFSLAQSHLYFGREREARDLLSLVIANRVVLFFAQSGAGKSSLINTRLIPGLEARGFEVLPVARVGGLEPASGIEPRNIFAHTVMTYLDGDERLQATFAQQRLPDLLPALTPATNAQGHTHWRYVIDEEAAEGSAGATDDAPAALESADTASGQEYELRPRVLIIDQFEEILTAHLDAWEQRDDFFQQLADALEEDPYLWLMLAMREDYVGGLTPFIHLLPGDLRVRYHMARMSIDAALEAIRQPAQLGGRTCDEGVAEQLVDNLRQIRVAGRDGTQPGQYLEPVQLQVVCFQLWENLQREQAATPGVVAHPIITQADLRTSGDVDSALTDFYEQAIKSVLGDSQITATERQLRHWFSNHLITSALTRSTAYRNEETGQTAGLPNSVVDALAARFLLRTELRAGGAWTELIHDRFVLPIRRANNRWFSQHPNPVALARQQWLQAGAADDQLPDGFALRELENFAQRNTADITDDERTFLTQCRNQAKARQQTAAAEQKRRRRSQMWTAAVMALLTALTGFALYQSNEAAKAKNTAESLQAEAVAQAEAAQAARVTAQSESTRAIANERVAATEAARAESQAQIAATAEAASMIEAKRADAEKNRAVGLLIRLNQQTLNTNKDYGDSSLILARDRVLIAPGVDADQDLRSAVANARWRRTIPPADSRHQGSVYAVAYSPDGQTIASGGADGTIRLWTATQLEPRQILLAIGEACCPWRSIPMGRNSSPPVMTAPCASGMWKAASPCPSSPAMWEMFCRWPSVPMGRSSPSLDMMAQCASGM